MSETERFFAGDHVGENEDEEVPNDAVQLMVIATFNGFCRLVAALARNGLLSPGQLRNIHGAMALPLDDPDWCDYSFVAGARDSIETVLSRAISDATELWGEPE